MEQIIESIRIINEELGAMQIDVAVLKTQMGEVLWLQRAVVAAIIVFIVAKGLKLIVKNNKNNKQK